MESLTVYVSVCTILCAVVNRGPNGPSFEKNNTARKIKMKEGGREGVIIQFARLTFLMIGGHHHLSNDIKVAPN